MDLWYNLDKDWLKFLTTISVLVEDIMGVIRFKFSFYRQFSVKYYFFA